MSLSEIYQSFCSGLLQTGPLEFIAVIAGIISVWFSRKESIWVYPAGLVNTTIYVFLSIKSHLLGEASVNLYYTIMSVYGWWLWTRKDNFSGTPMIRITHNSTKDWRQQLVFFIVAYFLLLLALIWAKKAFAPEAIPLADAFASATAYTGMWCMARKKVSSWYFWIATNLASIPLYFVKGFMFTSVQFLVLLVLAIAGLISWNQKASKQSPISRPL